MFPFQLKFWSIFLVSLQQKDMGPMKTGAMRGYKSAILDLYRTRCVPMDSTHNQILENLIKGYEKIMNSLRKKGFIKAFEGKRHLTSRGYRLIAEKLLSCTEEYKNTDRI